MHWNRLVWLVDLLDLFNYNIFNLNILFFNIIYIYLENDNEIKNYLISKTNQTKTPFLFINSKFESDYNKILSPSAIVNINDEPISLRSDNFYHYDLIVIGGGSGGLACSKVFIKLDCHIF